MELAPCVSLLCALKSLGQKNIWVINLPPSQLSHNIFCPIGYNAYLSPIEIAQAAQPRFLFVHHSSALTRKCLDQQVLTSSLPLIISVSKILMNYLQFSWAISNICRQLWRWWCCSGRGSKPGPRPRRTWSSLTTGSRFGGWPRLWKTGGRLESSHSLALEYKNSKSG